MLSIDVYAYDEDIRIVAILHDVVEDTEVTLDEIEDIFGAHVRYAVDAITEREGETYKDYIKRVHKNTFATVVKIADLQDNMDLSRYHGEDGLYTRYAKAYGVLTNHRSKWGK